MPNMLWEQIGFPTFYETVKVKIPNNHNRIMKESKSQYIAKDLQLKDSEFNALIDCPLTGPQYYALLRKKP